MRRTLLPYAIVELFAFIGFSLPLPILPEMFLDPERSILPGYSLHAKMILLGLVMASFPLGQFFGSPLLGRLSDWYGRKKVILISLAGTTLGYLITSFSVYSESVAGMFSGLALCGFCEGNVTIAQSVIADMTHKPELMAKKATYFGWLNIFISVGFIIGPLMGGQLADPEVVSWFTFATPFWMAACMTVLGMLLILLFSKETLLKRPDGKWQFFSSMGSGFKKPKLKLFYVANFFLALGYFAFFRFLPVFLERKFNFSASQLSYVIVYNSIAMGLGIMFLIPLLTKWLKPVQSLSLFSVFLALSYVICLLPQSPAALWMTIPPVGLGLAVAITNGSLIISNASSSTFQGQALGTLTSVQVLAEIITGLSGGVLAAHTVDLPLYIGAFMTLICAGLLLFSMKRREQDV